MLSVVLTDKNKVSGCRDDGFCRHPSVCQRWFWNLQSVQEEEVTVSAFVFVKYGGAASRGSDVSVILKERQQVIVAAAGKVWRIQVWQKIVWIHQIWQQLQEENKQNNQNCSFSAYTHTKQLSIFSAVDIIIYKKHKISWVWFVFVVICKVQYTNMK